MFLNFFALLVSSTLIVAKNHPTKFIPACGGDDYDYEDEAVTTVAPVPPSVWLGYSSKLFGGFFNLTIESNRLEPLGRCVASSSNFRLIEASLTARHVIYGRRCYRCLFVDAQSSPNVVQMRTTATQCLTSSSHAGSDTLYRVCAAMSPSLPMLTLLRVSHAQAKPCPFIAGNYRVEYSHSSCKQSSSKSVACIDRSGLNLNIEQDNSCGSNDDKLSGPISFHCLAHWKVDSNVNLQGDHQHHFVFIQSDQKIRCAVYTFENRRKTSFQLALASGFDCAELNGVVLNSRSHLVGKVVASHSLHFEAISPETATTTTTTTTTTSTSTTTTTSPLVTTSTNSDKKSQESEELSIIDSPFIPTNCLLPKFVSSSKKWLSFDATSYHVTVGNERSAFSISLPNKNSKLHLQCTEVEIGGDSSSRIYQAVYQVVHPNRDGAKVKRSVRKDFKCPNMANRSEAENFQLEVVNSTSNTRHRRHMAPTYRCVKFYQRDSHVIEIVVGKSKSESILAVCDEKEEHRAQLATNSVFLGRTASHCMTRQHRRHLSNASPAVANDALSPQCVEKMCAKSVKQAFFVLPKGSTCLDTSSPIQKCVYRWRRDYVTDNMLVASFDDTSTRKSLTCYVVQHNGISSSVSKVIPNPNCWLDNQKAAKNLAKSSILHDKNSSLPYVGVNFNTQDFCHLSSDTKPPKFVKSHQTSRMSVASVAARGTSQLVNIEHSSPAPSWLRLGDASSTSCRMSAGSSHRLLLVVLLCSLVIDAI